METQHITRSTEEHTLSLCNLKMLSKSPLYLVRPHEADEKYNRESHSEDVDTPEPRSLIGSQYEALNDTELEEKISYRSDNKKLRSGIDLFMLE